jgi:hypothetical protein
MVRRTLDIKAHASVVKDMLLVFLTSILECMLWGGG